MTQLILFDFDGTLADTAPDLVAAANQQRIKRQLIPLPYEQLRPIASQGARGLLREALGLTPEHTDFNEVRQSFLDDYERNIAVGSHLFEGIQTLLTQIEEQGYQWGIVTNKPTYLTLPLVKHFKLQAATVVCGDTTPTPKPHPAPLLLAAEQAGFSVADCWYIGDDLRDIQAGQAAGMKTIAAAYGYCGDDLPAHQWNADYLVHHAQDIWSIIQSY